MKFSEFPYQRPDYDALMDKIDALTQKMKQATCAAQQLEAMKELEQLRCQLRTSVQIATIRYTVDTRDAFYSAEEEYNEHLFCEKAPLKRPKRPTCESYQIDDPLE